MTAAVATGGTNRGAPLLWAAAALAALVAHAGVAAWALRQPSAPPAADATPAAVMIDLAPAPVAPEAVEEEVAPDLTDVPEIVGAPAEPPRPEALAATPPAVSPSIAVAMPETPAAPPVVAPPVVEPPVVAPPPEPPAEIAIVRPTPRPENLPRATSPPEPQQVERRPAPEPELAAPSQASRRAQVQAPVAQTVSAPSSSRGSAGAVSPARWQSQLMAHLERRKRYPSAARNRRAEGVAQVRFVIDAQGGVLSAWIARSSGHADLDAEVLALIRRASPVPAPPPGAPRDIIAPVQFKVR